jgi:hypothetical protein
MKNKPPTTHNQSLNTEKHNTHTENNEDTSAQHTPGTKNYASPNSYWRGAQINKPLAILSTNDGKCTNQTEKTNKLDQTLGNHQISQINYIPEEPAQKITQKQSTKHKQIIPQHETLVPPVYGGFSAPQAFQGSRHIYFNLDQSQTTGGLQNNRIQGNNRITGSLWSGPLRLGTSSSTLLSPPSAPHLPCATPTSVPHILFQVQSAKNKNKTIFS